MRIQQLIPASRNPSSYKHLRLVFCIYIRKRLHARALSRFWKCRENWFHGEILICGLVGALAWISAEILSLEYNLACLTCVFEFNSKIKLCRIIQNACRVKLFNWDNFSVSVNIYFVTTRGRMKWLQYSQKLTREQPWEFNLWLASSSNALVAGYTFRFLITRPFRFTGHRISHRSGLGGFPGNSRVPVIKTFQNKDFFRYLFYFIHRMHK